jgi:hypothetical protein
MKHDTNVPGIQQFYGTPFTMQSACMLAKKISSQFNPDGSDEFQFIVCLENP